jgi:hypothetical protein
MDRRGQSHDYKAQQYLFLVVGPRILHDSSRGHRVAVLYGHSQRGIEIR